MRVAKQRWGPQKRRSDRLVAIQHPKVLGYGLDSRTAAVDVGQVAICLGGAAVEFGVRCPVA